MMGDCKIMFNSDFDWMALKQQIQKFESVAKGTRTPVTDAWSKYVRLQRFLRENSHMMNWVTCRDAVLDISIEFNFTPRKAAVLYLRLQRISSRHQFGLTLESMKRAASATKALAKIYNPLNRLAQFSGTILSDPATAQMRIVEKKLENAAHFWASNKLKETPKSGDVDKLEEIRSYGFDFQVVANAEYGDFSDYHSYSMVRQWLRTNVMIGNLVKDILEKEGKSKVEIDANPNRKTHWIDELSEVENLTGHQLPNLYEALTSKQFKITQDKIQKTVMEDGVKFVAMAMKAIGLKSLGAETIASHRKAVLKVKPKSN